MAIEDPQNIRERVSVLEERGAAIAQLIDERDRLYLEKFRASEIAVSAAIVASDKQNTASFGSSEKAIVKAEEAQREYNIRSNEFRGQLDDQAKLLMPRSECQTLFNAYEDKLEDMKERIAAIREIQSKGMGGHDASQSGQARSQWLIYVLLIGLFLFLNLGVSIFAVLKK